ncbi:MAG: nucleoside-diphosphate kinase [Candidatus Paceibacterota bacterium]
MMQKTLVLIKPDGVKRAISGKIISRFEDTGLKINGMKLTWIDKEFSKKHYSEHVKKSFYKTLEKFITSGPVLAMVLEGVNAIEVVRKMVGNTEPLKAMPGTIRGDFAHLDTEWANCKNKCIPNLIHASDSPESAKKEISLWFDNKELYNYNTANENFVF